MSTLSVTTINTANGITDLTLATGNSSAGKIIFPAAANNIRLVGNVGISNTAPATGFQIGGNYGIFANNVGSGNNFNINCAAGNYFALTCNGSAANVYFTNTPSNTLFTVVLEIANGGANTLSWSNTPKWSSASAPTASTNTDVWVFITRDAGTTWRGIQSMKDSR